MNPSAAAAPADALAALQSLAGYDGDPGEFWRRYSAGVAGVCGATACRVLIRRPDGRWVTAARWPTGAAEADDPDPAVLDGWLELAADGPCGVAADGAVRVVAAALAGPSGTKAGLVVVDLRGAGDREADEAGIRLGLALALPGHYELRRALAGAQQDAGRMASALDLMAMLNAETKFLPAAMLLCNEVASRFSADRAGLGWLESNAVALRALSHTEKIELKMQAVQQLAAAMEESIDQEEEIVVPRPEGQPFVTRAHETYATARGVPHVATLPVFEPLADEQKEGATPAPVGALTLERSSAPFSLAELRTLRLMLDQAARPLGEMHRNMKWFGARAAAATRKKAAGLLGAEHTWWKLFAVLLAAALLVLVFGRKEYEVEAPFTTRTDAMAHLVAPFDGHIRDVLVQPGDPVKAGDLLVALDVRELLLQREAAAAERGRHEADALKAESSGDVAGMRVARAQAEQARVQWQMVSDRLAQAEIRAPFDGLVVEGDLRERIAAPVQKGDLLLKVGRIEDLYVVAAVSERDVQDVTAGAAGRAAFAGQPGKRFAFKVERVEPVARTDAGGNAFSVHCRFDGSAEDWWRPGMSGVAKIEAGRRSLLWIYTHRTTDFLRMWWW